VFDTSWTTTDANPEADDMSYAYLYNANGDVGQVVDPNGPPGCRCSASSDDCRLRTTADTAVARCLQTAADVLRDAVERDG